MSSISSQAATPAQEEAGRIWAHSRGFHAEPISSYLTAEGYQLYLRESGEDSEYVFMRGDDQIVKYPAQILVPVAKRMCLFHSTIRSLALKHSLKNRPAFRCTGWKIGPNYSWLMNFRGWEVWFSRRTHRFVAYFHLCTMHGFVWGRKKIVYYRNQHLFERFKHTFCTTE
jgi:hypothetical protein